MKTYPCPCKEGKHEIDEKKGLYEFLVETIEKQGEYIKVTSAKTGKSYSVPRIYIAMHGVKGNEISNFEQI